jgi:hypothetical protein
VAARFSLMESGCFRALDPGGSILHFAKGKAQANGQNIEEIILY